MKNEQLEFLRNTAAKLEQFCSFLDCHLKSDDTLNTTFLYYSTLKRIREDAERASVAMDNMVGELESWNQPEMNIPEDNDSMKAVLEKLHGIFESEKA